jgi:hypothetical protein
MDHPLINIFLNQFQVHAAEPTPTPASLGTFQGVGLFGGEGFDLTRIENAAGLFVTILSSIIGVITIIGFIWFLFVFFVGAISWISSGGDKAKVQNAQKQLTNGIIGLILVISAIFIFQIIGLFFGINPVSDINDLIIKLGPQ